MTENLLRALAADVGLSAFDTARIVINAYRRYKVYSIPKRSGGERVIAHPARELKAIQRVVLAKYLSSLPVSVAAMAYVRGKGIRENAELHAKSEVILKLDFKDFFHSISPADLLERLTRTMPLDQVDREIFARLLFWRNEGKFCLAIGAPSSPAISNIVMYEFDEVVLAKSAECGVIYSRYADDLTFSSDSVEKLVVIEKFVSELLSNSTSPSLRLNNEKRGIYSRGMRRMITGVKITPDGTVSIGRDRKRMISAAINNIKAKKVMVLPSRYQEVRGWLAFANAVEPEFLNRLRKKYGAVVDELLRSEFRRFYKPKGPTAPSS